MTEVTLLRRGAVVRIPTAVLGPELPVLALTFVDLEFDDGHVERWFGPAVLGTTPEDPELATVVEWAQEDVVDDQAEALLSDLAEDGLEIPPDGLARTPVEIVFEWNVPLPSELGPARSSHTQGLPIAQDVVGCLLLWLICFPLYLMRRESKPRKASTTAAPPAPAGDWNHPQFSAPTAAPERLSVPPPPKR